MADPIRILHFADLHIGMENYGRLYAILGPARVKDIVFTARLVEAPLDLAPVVQGWMQPHAAEQALPPRAWIFTSATLGTDDALSWFTEPLGLAQARILREVDACLSEPGQGDVLFVGHGGVGTLLFCALGGLPISRIHDQGPGGGGCWFGFDLADRKPHHGWQAMELLSAQ